MNRTDRRTVESTVKSNIIAFPVNTKKKSGRVATLLLLAFVVGTAVFWMCNIVAGSRERLNKAEIAAYYNSLEKQLLADTRAVLEQEGFHNSGIMLNHQVDMDGNRSYMLTIHHGRIDDLSEEARAELSEEIENCYFAENNCVIRQEFLIYD